ncbi:DUF2254 domain-containing protein [soil metagenome]
MVPAIWSASAVLLGLALPQVDEVVVDWVPLLFEGGVDSARSVLSSTAGGMISVTGLVFSITIVVLQLASSQFSPRVLATFLEDRITQHTLGVFAASFLYSLTVLRSIADRGDSKYTVPQLAVTIAFVFVLGAMAMFLVFIQHITQSISVSTVIGRVGTQTRHLLERSRERRTTLPNVAPELPDLAGQTVATACRTGYIDALDADALCRMAADHEVRIQVLYPIGSFVAEGAALVLIQGARTDDAWDDRIGSAITLGSERSMSQDLSFGFRRLVDIAERALSPGTNDPTTAVQAIDELHDILRRMVAEPGVVGVHVDDDGTPRLLTQEWTFGQFLDLAVDEIAHWGRDSIQIPRRLQEMLADLAVASHLEHRAVINAKANGIDALASSSS